MGGHAVGGHKCPYCVDGLTSREMEVLDCISRGMTAQEISDELVLAMSSVRRYLHNMYSKTGTSHMTGLLVYAIEHGLLSTIVRIKEEVK